MFKPRFIGLGEGIPELDFIDICFFKTLLPIVISPRFKIYEPYYFIYPTENSRGQSREKLKIMTIIKNCFAFPIPPFFF